MRIILAVAVAACAIACQPVYQPYQPPQRYPHTMRKVPITPAIVSFVAARYKEPVLNALMAPSTADVFAPQSIVAVRRAENLSDGWIWAIGNVDAQNVYGAKLRQAYIVKWHVIHIPTDSHPDGGLGMENHGFCISIGEQGTGVLESDIENREMLLEANDAAPSTRPVDD